MLVTLGDGLVAQTGSGQERSSAGALVNMIAYVLGVTSTERVQSEGRAPAVAGHRQH